MAGLFTLGLLAIAGLILLASLSFVGHLLGFLIALPFRILGFVFRLLGFVIALPFLILGLVIAVVFGGFGLALAGGVLLLPLLPFALAIAGVIWLLKRRPRPAH